MSTPTRARARPSVLGLPLPALLMGLGFGGFIDGILLHQVLQWHHMVSAERAPTTVAGLELNTLADGLFHAVTWLFVVAGSKLLWRSWRRGLAAPPGRAQLGGLVAGWGVFDVVEGLVDHQILGVHHVRDDLGGPVSWDLGFLALGVLLVLAGVALARSAPPAGVRAP